MNDAFAALSAECDAEGIAVPPVPEAFRPELRRVGLLRATTMSEPAPAYLLDGFVADFVATARDARIDAVHVAHAGRGSNSWAMHFYVIVGGLGIFVQSAWGGELDTDEVDLRQRARLADRYEAVERLLAHGDALAPDSSMCVVATDFGRSRWALWDDSATPTWIDSHDPLDEAVERLAAIG